MSGPALDPVPAAEADDDLAGIAVRERVGSVRPDERRQAAATRQRLGRIPATGAAAATASSATTAAEARRDDRRTSGDDDIGSPLQGEVLMQPTVSSGNTACVRSRARTNHSSLPETVRSPDATRLLPTEVAADDWVRFVRACVEPMATVHRYTNFVIESDGDTARA